jgi:hypothetical protein
MRETASLASSFERQRLPAGLMQRLEMMQQLALQATASDGRKPQVPAVRRLPRPGAQVIVMAWFSLGVMASGAAGVGALSGLRALEARGTPLTWASVRASLGTTLASAWANMPPVAFAPGSGAQSDGPWERVEVKIDPARRAHAPLGLSVTGGDGRPVLFVLDGVPEGVRPSHGVAVGPSTWVVGSADIGGLHLVLDQGAPGAFEVKIALLAPTGVARSGSVVAVHLVDGAALKRAAAESAGKGGPVALAAAAKDNSATEAAAGRP